MEKSSQQLKLKHLKKNFNFPQLTLPCVGLQHKMKQELN